MKCSKTDKQTKKTKCPSGSLAQVLLAQEIIFFSNSEIIKSWSILLTNIANDLDGNCYII